MVFLRTNKRVHVTLTHIFLRVHTRNPERSTVKKTVFLVSSQWDTTVTYTKHISVLGVHKTWTSVSDSIFGRHIVFVISSHSFTWNCGQSLLPCCLRCLVHYSPGLPHCPCICVVNSLDNYTWSCTVNSLDNFTCSTRTVPFSTTVYSWS